MIIRHHGSPEAYWAASLSDDELSRFRAVKGDPLWQAEWGLLAILISLHVFRSQLVESTAQIEVPVTQWGTRFSAIEKMRALPPTASEMWRVTSSI